MHGYDRRTPAADVDVVYFDANDLRPEAEDVWEHCLRGMAPDVPWELKNPAAVHLWYERRRYVTKRLNWT